MYLVLPFLIDSKTRKILRDRFVDQIICNGFKLITIRKNDAFLSLEFS
jgi:hypothetical protein